MVASTNINLYKRITDTTSTDLIGLDILLSNIQDGRWQDQILKLRNTKDEAEYSKLKNSLPCVTISGTFSKRKDDALIEHSSFICIDIDKCDPEETKAIVCSDDHVYAAFTSCSGNGLAVLFKINGNKHKEAFYGILEYLSKQYSITADPSCVNVSRTRYVSFDPDIYINEKAKQFTKYPPKKEITHIKESKIVFVRSDFDRIIQTIDQRKIDIAGCYMDWLRIGFALADKFGEDGREAFQIISQYRDGEQARNIQLIDKQYDACLKSKNFGVTMGTFYYIVKRANIELYSEETRTIIKTASAQKRAGGMSDEAIKQNLKEFSDIPHEMIDEAVPQVEKDTFLPDMGIVEKIQIEIQSNWNIRRNVISRNYEIEDEKGNWTRMEESDFNTIFISIKKHIKETTSELVNKIIISNDTPDYNPITTFFAENIKLSKDQGLIDQLAGTITSGFGLDGEDRALFLKKWMVGAISAVHGKHSPLTLVLAGRTQNTGKTEWFRRLLPSELKPYYAESKLDAGKDDEILMTQKWFIMDDEMGGKSKREAARLKELTSKQVFSLREPYGRNNVDLNRLAVLCGTTNDDGILNDPTGNRRIIPFNVIALDHKTYNSIDKTALWMEAYHLWKTGFNWEMTFDDIRILSENTVDFEEESIEQQLINKYFSIPQYEQQGECFTSTDIVEFFNIELKFRTTPKKIGMYLQKMGIERQSFLRNDKISKGYRLIKHHKPLDDFRQIDDDQKVSKNVSEKKNDHFSKQPEISEFDPDCPF